MVSGVWAERRSMLVASERLPGYDQQPAGMKTAAEFGEFSWRILTN